MTESYILHIQSFNSLSNIIQFFFNQKEIMNGNYFHYQNSNHTAFMYKNEKDQYITINNSATTGIFSINLNKIKWLHKNAIINVTPLDNLDLPYELISDKNILKFSQFFEKNYKGHSFDLVSGLFFNNKHDESLNQNNDNNNKTTKEDLIKKNPNIADHINSYLENRKLLSSKVNLFTENMWNDFLNSLQKNKKYLEGVQNSQITVNKVENPKSYHCCEMVIDLIRTWCKEEKIELPSVLQGDDIINLNCKDIYPQKLYNLIRKLSTDNIIEIEKILRRD